MRQPLECSSRGFRASRWSHLPTKEIFLMDFPRQSLRGGNRLSDGPVILTMATTAHGPCVSNSLPCIPFPSAGDAGLSLLTIDIKQGDIG